MFNQILSNYSNVKYKFYIKSNGEKQMTVYGTEENFNDYLQNEILVFNIENNSANRINSKYSIVVKSSEMSFIIITHSK